MNADVFVSAGTLHALLEAADDPRVAMTGPFARTPAGEAQDLGVPYRLHYARLRWRARHGGAQPPSIDVPWLSGCMQLVRMEAVRRVGGMDASLRFYNEDLDWSLRLRRAGCRLRLVATEVVHEGGASTPADARFLFEGLRGGYVVSRRYAAPMVRAGHRLGVLAAAEVAVRTAKSEDARSAWHEVAKHFRTGELERSRFGPTLSEHG